MPRPDSPAVHPLGSRAKVLLTSVFGPYAQDDVYGSRAINPMELYQNQVTRVQGAFSLRTFHRSWGIMMLQANVTAPSTLLDFPSQERFLEEITRRQYDVIGITAIMTNLMKVRRMCKLIRKHQPHAEIVLGGHIANMPDVRRWVDVDHVVLGEGVRWLRRYLGEDESAPLRHPVVRGNIGTRIMGVTLRDHPGDVCATLLPSVGCPMGCNFCSTSALFGGKGSFVEFYHTGDELFEIMCQLEERLNTPSFFVMDENFLIDKPRALELLELMEQHGKPWSLYVFSSANVLRKYRIDQLVALGVSWVWLGLEGKRSQYVKLAGTDTRELVRTLQQHGIRVLGSSIIGLEEHTPENIDEAIDHAVAHATEFHQFMLYTPIPGTPLFQQMAAEGRVFSEAETSVPDTHGQHIFNFRHPHIPPGQETEFLLRAFRRDFEVNGPSVVRIIRTVLRGWQTYRDHPNPRIRARFAHEAANLPVRYAGVLWAAKRYYDGQPRMRQMISELLDELIAACGPEAARAAPIYGRRLYGQLLEEEERLASGQTYEPPTYYEVNEAASLDNPAAALIAPAMPLPMAAEGGEPPKRRAAFARVAVGVPSP
ncbi:MAG: B12-binding domain-containing radical SAM protein [Planctomycetota bacterium]|nr:MAG: B12-binding domain-containing radical SAM protein [Planctomycetota bacterium]